MIIIDYRDYDTNHHCLLRVFYFSCALILAYIHLIREHFYFGLYVNFFFLAKSLVLYVICKAPSRIYWTVIRVCLRRAEICGASEKKLIWVANKQLLFRRLARSGLTDWMKLEFTRIILLNGSARQITRRGAVS